MSRLIVGVWEELGGLFHQLVQSSGGWSKVVGPTTPGGVSVLRYNTVHYITLQYSSVMFHPRDMWNSSN